jgi:hypothetical protein
MHIGFSALALMSAGAVGAWFARRAGFWGFWFGGSLLVALLSVASAVAVPGASYLPLLAAWAAALAALPCLMSFSRGRTPRPGAVDVAAIVPALILFAVLLPLLLLLYPALGAPAWPIVTVTLCLAAGFLLPTLANAGRSARRFVTLLGAGVAFAGISITLLLPMYSPAWPQRINIEYWVDADSGHAHWWMQAASPHLPHAMASAVKFDPVARPRFAGYPLKGFFADAPALALAAPQLEISAASGTSQAATHVELLLQSARGAPTAFVVFPASAHIEEVVVATPSGPLRAKLHTLRSGDTALVLANIPSEGFKFGIDAAAPITLQVFDQSYGLPEQLAEGQVLQRARPQNATSSQNGDVTVVQRTVRLDPAAGR